MRQRAAERADIALHRKRKRDSETIEHDQDNGMDERRSSRNGAEEDETESEEEESCSEHPVIQKQKKKHVQLPVLLVSPKQRLKAREEAFDAARQGRWERIGLQSVMGSHMDFEDEL